MTEIFYQENLDGFAKKKKIEKSHRDFLPRKVIENFYREKSPRFFTEKNWMVLPRKK